MGSVSYQEHISMKVSRVGPFRNRHGVPDCPAHRSAYVELGNYETISNIKNNENI